MMVEKGKPSAEKGRVRFILINLIRLLLVLAFIGAFFNNRKLVLFISIIAIIITFLPKILKDFFDIELPAQFEVIIILFIYGTLFFGKVRGFYAEFWWWSIMFSIASAIALGFVGIAVMYSLYKRDRIHGSPFVIAFFSFCFAVAVGTIWELFEFSLDSLFGFNLQATGNLMVDLISNMTGALAVSFIGYFYIKDGKIGVVSKVISRFVEKNPKIFGVVGDPGEGVLNLINKGEGDKLEFKSTLRTNLHTNQMDRKIEHSALKTITAYLNSDGGTLLIGVNDNRELVGIDKDNFPSNDKLSLHFTNLIKSHIVHEYLPFIRFEIVKVKDKDVLKVDCRDCDKHVFLKIDGNEEFYIRNGPSSARLEGSALVDYIRNKFGRGL